MVHLISQCVGLDQVDAEHSGLAAPFEPNIARAGRVLIGHFSWNMISSLVDCTHFITVFRDPYERAASLYRFWRNADQRVADSGPPSFGVGSRIAKSASFREFILNEHPHVISQIRDGQSLYLLSEDEWYRRNADLPRALALCKERLGMFRLIGTVEHIDRFVGELRSVDDRFSRAQLPHLNRTDMDGEHEGSCRDLFLSLNPLDMSVYEMACEVDGNAMSAALAPTS